MLRAALTVSALILTVFLVRAAFRNRVPKRMIYRLILWSFHSVTNELTIVVIART